MYRQVTTKPRKKPTQERARATVDAILAATARVLVRRGFEHCTTNAVAEEAGVSVGSLYQYFPNKEALVGALIEQHMNEITHRVLSELTRVARLPFPEAVRAVIQLMVEAHSVNPKLHRVLTEQVPRVGNMAKLQQLDALCHSVVAGLLATRRDELAIADPDTAAFVLVSAIEAITHRAALFAPERLRDPKLIEESCLLVTRYLGVAEG